MNSSIRNLFVLFVLLFGVLVAFTSRWTVFEDGDLRANSLNRRDVIRASRVPRGRITAADGTTLARSRKVTSRDTGDSIYTRVYPQGEPFAAVVGYSDTSLGQQAGLERSQNEFLSGDAVKLATAVDRLLQGDERGDDIRTTLQPSVMKAAIQGLNGRAGSVVALEPETGKVLAMVTVPSYDPDSLIEGGAAYRKKIADRDAWELNRATQAQYVPGSTFKVVTAAAALDSGRFTPDTVVDGSNNQRFSGVPLGNYGGEDPGQVTVRQALVGSVNGAFGNIAVDLGGRALQTQMEKFGFGAFGDDPPLDYPTSQMRPSGIFRKDRLIPANSRFVDLARTGIGQDKLGATPLQMAMVVSAVANDGKLMKPHLVDRVIDPDGRVRSEVEPEVFRQSMKASTAASLRGMMADVVDEGTGTPAAIGGGVQVGGKTGTAELGNVSDGINNLWFVGFAPVQDPKVAVAVIVENSPGQGGQVAAPIAKTVIQSALAAGAGR